MDQRGGYARERPGNPSITPFKAYHWLRRRTTNRVGFTKIRAITPFRSHAVTKANREQVTFCVRGVATAPCGVPASVDVCNLIPAPAFPPSSGFGVLVLLHRQLFANPGPIHQMGLTRRLRWKLPSRGSCGFDASSLCIASSR